jgi:hypothetical protein
VTRPLPLLLAICALGIFASVEWPTIHRAFGNSAVPYLVGLGAVVIGAYARAAWDAPFKGMIRAALASWVGSVAGYLLALVAYDAEHHRVTSGIALHEWLVVAAAFPYLGTDGWGLGIALMLPSLVGGIYAGLRAEWASPLT